MKTKRSNYNHLSYEERLVCYKMRSEGKSIREICRALGRPETAAGSLSREFKRNTPRSPILRGKLDSFDIARYAEEQAGKRRKKPRKNYKLESDPALKEFVEDKLKNEQASPRDIHWRVKRELAGKSISHTAIYDYTKRHRGLIQNLRRKGKPCKQRITKRKKPKDKSVKRRNISERSSVVEQKLEYGHYEVDTIVSPRAASSSAILTLRELCSRMRWFFLIADLKAETTLAVMRGFFSHMPAHLRRTLTADNGPENKELYQLEDLFYDFKVYYSDPYSPWQRGSVEQANGEFRWYFPKGTDFKNVPIGEVWKVQDKLNRRCMDCLGGKTSAEVFQKALQNPPRIFLADALVLRSNKALCEAVGLRFEQNSSLYLPLQNQSGCNSFYT
jgi:transposase, IS30 family